MGNSESSILNYSLEADLMVISGRRDRTERVESARRYSLLKISSGRDGRKARSSSTAVRSDSG